MKRNRWQSAVYTVDDTNATLHTAMNKGREAFTYLTYIIDHYENLPDVVVFLHSHRDGYPEAWHNDAPNYDNVKSIRELQIDFVLREGYVNIRCRPIPGCPDEIQPFRDPPEEHREAEHAFVDACGEMFYDGDVPRVIGVACCSQFAVSRKQIRARSKDDYDRYLHWLISTPLSDAVSGRVFEYLWHIIYGKDAIQ